WIIPHVSDKNRLALRGCGAGEALVERERQLVDDLRPVPDSVPDAQTLALLVIEQDGEQLAVDDLLDDIGDIGEQLIEIQRLRSDCRHFEQKIEQLGALAKTHGGFSWGRHFQPGSRRPAVASTIFTLALAPMRLAPAAAIFCKSSRVRTPP